MSYEIRMSDLGIAGDDAVFSGTTPGDVVEQVVGHLRSEHDVDMPDADDILAGGEQWAMLPVANLSGGSGGDRYGAVVQHPNRDVVDDDSVGANLVVRRLREQLDLWAKADHPEPAGSTVALAGDNAGAGRPS